MILVVDDDRELVDLLKIWLEAGGYDVQTAPDGAAAHDAAMSDDCQCMILDVNMPNINGPALLLILHSEGRHVPVIVMTGVPGFTKREMQQFDNVVAFLEKPVQRDAFMATIEQHARR